MTSESGFGGPVRGRGVFANFLAVGRSIRGALFRSGRILPALVAIVLLFVALRPMLFEPAVRVDGLLGSMAGVGLSFASVTLSAANAGRERRRWSASMVEAALMLLRFSLAAVLALALTYARTRLTTDFGSETPIDYLLRGATALVTALAIALAFLGFRALVLLLGPGLEEEPAPPDAP